MAELLEEEQEKFPGLNKRHGFFRAIERNQVSRDDYHWSEEERKVQDKKRQKRERSRPDKMVYTPPRARGNREYGIEIEVKPQVIWRTTVNEVSM